jgi:hypothetical protein
MWELLIDKEPFADLHHDAILGFVFLARKLKWLTMHYRLILALYRYVKQLGS